MNLVTKLPWPMLDAGGGQCLATAQEVLARPSRYRCPSASGIDSLAFLRWLLAAKAAGRTAGVSFEEGFFGSDSPSAPRAYSPGYLFTDIGKGNNPAKFNSLPHRPDDAPADLCRRCVLLGMLRQAAFGFSMGQGHAGPSKSEYAKGVVTAKAVHVSPWGRDMAETLELNWSKAAAPRWPALFTTGPRFFRGDFDHHARCRRCGDPAHLVRHMVLTLQNDKLEGRNLPSVALADPHAVAWEGPPSRRRPDLPTVRILPAQCVAPLAVDVPLVQAQTLAALEAIDPGVLPALAFARVFRSGRPFTARVAAFASTKSSKVDAQIELTTPWPPGPAPQPPARRNNLSRAEGVLAQLLALPLHAAQSLARHASHGGLSREEMSHLWGLADRHILRKNRLLVLAHLVSLHRVRMGGRTPSEARPAVLAHLGVPDADNSSAWSAFVSSLRSQVAVAAEQARPVDFAALARELAQD